MDHLHLKSGVDIARLIRERKISAAETLEHFIARVAKYNPKLNASHLARSERARQRARAADAALARARSGGRFTACP